MRPFEKPILCKTHSTVLTGIGFVQTLLRHPEISFIIIMLLLCKNLTKDLPPHLWALWLKELLGVVAEVLHHLLLPELLHLPAGRALVLLHLPVGGISLSQ